MKAGFSEKDVTPPVGVYLAGYPSRDEPSEGVDDPLMLRVLAIEDNAGERLVLVTGDLLKFPKDMAWRTKLWCERTLGLKSPLVVINLSHTHAAPTLFIQRCYPHWPLDRDYIRTFEQSIRDGIRAAVEDLKPVRIGYGRHEAHFGVSRRLPDPERGGRVKMAPNPDGYDDPELPVLAFHDADDSLVAVLYSYACHPTSKNTLNISADYPGQVSRGLKRELGDDVLTFFVQGAGASIAPRMHLRDGLDRYEQYWADVAADIAAFVRTGSMRDIAVELEGAEKEFLIPYDMDKLPTTDELLALADPGDSPIPEAMRPANRSIVRLWARDILEKVRTGTLDTGFRMHLARIRLNDALQIIAMSGEVTADVGRMVKDAFPDTETLFFGYCSYTDAYIPAAAMLDQGGHEALGSIYFHDRPAPFVKEIDTILKREALSLEL